MKCERCGASPECEYNGEARPESVEEIRLVEVQANFGVTTVMCLYCRKMWQKFMNASKTMREYTETGFRLEHWRMAHRKTGKEDIEIGLGFVRKLNDLDEVLYKEASNWIRAGTTREEMAARPTTSSNRDS